MIETKEQLAEEYIRSKAQFGYAGRPTEIFIAGYEAALQNIAMDNLDRIEKEPLSFIMIFALKRLSKEQIIELEKWCDSYQERSLLIESINWDQIEEEWIEYRKSQSPDNKTRFIDFIELKLKQ